MYLCPLNALTLSVEQQEGDLALKGPAPDVPAVPELAWEKKIR